MRNNNQNRWPDFYIVGAPKSGTTSIYHTLKAIPGVYLSPTKEPHFFSPQTATRIQIERVKSPEQYLKLFRDAGPDDILGEASSGYLRSPETPALIYEKSPQAKIIILIREPGSRAFSHYLMRWRSGAITTPFIDGLNHWRNDQDSLFSDAVVRPGFYAQQIPGYLHTFGEANVKIILFETLITDGKNVFNEMQSFLNISVPLIIDAIPKHNDYKAPRGKLALSILCNKSYLKWFKPLLPAQLKWKLIRIFFHKKSAKPVMSQEERKVLTKIYLDDVKALRRLLKKPDLWAEYYPVD